MLSEYLISPSMCSLLVTGILLIIITINFFLNIKQILKESIVQQIILLCVTTSAFGIHGMLHLGIEKQYGFNPYRWV